MDDDGVEIGKPVPIKVKVIVKGDEMTIDLSEVSKQVRGFYNSGITTGYACSQVAYKCLTSPTDYPINDGSFRSLKVIVPPGRIVSATRPAPMRYWMTYPMTIIDTRVQGAVEGDPGPRHRRPSRRPRAVARCTGSIRRRRNSSSPISARSAAAGAPSAARTASAAPSRSTTATPTIRRTSSRRRNSRWWSSAMRWCRIPAAPAAIAAGSASSAWCARAPTWCSTPRSSAPIAGRGASKAGSKAPAIRSGCAATATGRPTSRTARCSSTPLRPGDAYRIRSGGGGGYGDPHERPAELVAEDVRQGYVSAEVARRALRRRGRPGDVRARQGGDGEVRARADARPLRAASDCRAILPNSAAARALRRSGRQLTSVTPHPSSRSPA